MTETQTMELKQASKQTLGGTTVGRSLWGDARLRLWRDKVAMLCLAIVMLYALVAIGGLVYEIIAANNDNVPTFTETSDYKNVNQPPSTKSWLGLLGTDWAGKSVLLKTILGTRVSMTVGLFANIIAVPLGMLLGAISGYYGGKIDAVIVWIYSTLSSIPGLILLIAFRFTFKEVGTIGGIDMTGINGLCVAMAIVSWIGTCRLVRAETMKLRELDYVLAARACGRGKFSILLRHVMPNVMHLGIISFSLGFVGAIKAEVMLTYIGQGVKVGTPSWGTMINEAQTDIISGRYWEISSAVVAMFIIVLAWSIFGDRLRDALDPKLKNV